MKAYIRKMDITPTEPVYLCGHAIRTELSQGIMDPLYVTSLVVEDNEKKMVFISYDLILMDKPLTDLVKEAVSKEVGCSKENIICSFIHNHAAPETDYVSAFNDPDKGVRPGYREFLVEQAKKSVENILLEEVDLYYTTTQIEGYYSNRNSITKPCDKSANMMKWVRKDGSLLALMVNMTCHPTVLGPQNYLVSADLFGALRTGLAKEYQCEVLMMQGAAGDMGNRQYRQGNDQKELFRMRDGILPQLCKDFTWRKVEVDTIQFTPTSYIMDYDIDLNDLKKRLKVNEDILAKETDANQIKLLTSGTVMLRRVIEMGSHVHIELLGHVIQLNDVVWVCVPCELFNQLGVKIKKSVEGKDVLIWGYCDYSVGYLVEKDEYGKSYESIATQIRQGESESYTESLIQDLKECLQ